MDIDAAYAQHDAMGHDGIGCGCLDGLEDAARAAAAIAYATERGAKDGRNAAEFHLQFVIGGYADGHDVAPNARWLLNGIADGDPRVLDTLPTADLSGEWADTLTGPQLVDDARYAAGLKHNERHDLYADPFWPECDACVLTQDAFQDICGAYELAFSEAFSAEAERQATDVLNV